MCIIPYYPLLSPVIPSPSLFSPLIPRIEHLQKACGPESEGQGREERQIRWKEAVDESRGEGREGDREGDREGKGDREMEGRRGTKEEFGVDNDSEVSGR